MRHAYQSQHARSWRKLARLLIRAGQLQEARKALAVAIFWEPNNPTSQNDRANLSLLLGDTLDVVQCYYRLLQHDSRLADVMGVVLPGGISTKRHVGHGYRSCAIARRMLPCDSMWLKWHGSLTFKHTMNVCGARVIGSYFICLTDNVGW